MHDSKPPVRWPAEALYHRLSDTTPSSPIDIEFCPKHALIGHHQFWQLGVRRFRGDTSIFFIQRLDRQHAMVMRAEHDEMHPRRHRGLWRRAVSQPAEFNMGFDASKLGTLPRMSRAKGKSSVAAYRYRLLCPIWREFR